MGYFVVKKDVTNVIFYVQISQIKAQKKRNRSVHLGCIILCLHFFVQMDCYNISRRGLTRVAYPEQGNARARTWDRRTVETPTSFVLYISKF